MSSTDDQRTPDGTVSQPDGADTTSEWAPRRTPGGPATPGLAGPEQQSAQARQVPEQPTEQFDATRYPDTQYPDTRGVQYTSNPYEAYGTQPTQAYPIQSHPTETYPTQAYPAQAYPTQAYPAQDHPGQGGYPGGQVPNPTQAYPVHGTHPGQAAYAGQDGFPGQGGYQGQQAPNPTQAYPTYAAYQDQAGPGHPPPGTPTPPGRDGTEPDGEKKGRGPLYAAIAVIALLLVAVVGIGSALFGSKDDATDTAASAPTTSRTPAPRTTTSPPSVVQTPQREIEPPDLSRIPGGVGEAIGAVGAAVGSISSNDDGTLTLDGIGGSTVTVTTDASTQVIALGANSVDDLGVGETVVVQGDRKSDGTVAARIIISTTIPDFGGHGGN